ncbi:MAG: hypothetical protein CSA55_03675 [Ilumatobacter coccineus]|uniref:Lipoprotein n=1 Tax=Ilumatobacter coccineus TaxID=467094 RepID=A0A2G6K9F0_9ACTN|nr:MAG: hypothetical protein CSA55_03675 [Ilumatobacter coccineus]
MKRIAPWAFVGLSAIAGCGADAGAKMTESTESETTEVASGEPTDQYGDPQSYGASFGGQIIVDGDAMRIGVGGARDDPSPQAYLAFFVRDHPDLNTDLTLSLDEPVIVAGYRVVLTTVNVQSRHVILEVQEPIKADDET